MRLIHSLVVLVFLGSCSDELNNRSASESEAASNAALVEDRTGAPGDPEPEDGSTNNLTATSCKYGPPAEAIGIGEIREGSTRGTVTRTQVCFIKPKCSAKGKVFSPRLSDVEENPICPSGSKVSVSGQTTLLHAERDCKNSSVDFIPDREIRYEKSWLVIDTWHSGCDAVEFKEVANDLDEICEDWSHTVEGTLYVECEPEDQTNKHRNYPNVLTE